MSSMFQKAFVLASLSLLPTTVSPSTIEERLMESKEKLRLLNIKILKLQAQIDYTKNSCQKLLIK